MRLAHPQPVLLRFAALFTVLRVVLLWGAMLFTGFCLIAQRDWLQLALVFIGLATAVVLAAFLLSLAPRCIVCRCTLFLPKTCSKHPDTTTLWGSRLLRMCADILSKPTFRCVYCGERCACGDDSVEFSEPTAEDYLQYATAQYRELWQKPPKPTVEAILTPTEHDPVMRNYSPFGFVPADARPAQISDAHRLRRLLMQRHPQNPRAPHAEPFESALPYPILRHPSVNAALAVIPATPFRELWHREQERV